MSETNEIILKILKDRHKLGTITISETHVEFLFFTSFVSGGTPVKIAIVPGMDIEEAIVARCRAELIKEQNHLQANLDALRSRVGAMDEALKKTNSSHRYLEWLVARSKEAPQPTEGTA